MDSALAFPNAFESRICIKMGAVTEFWPNVNESPRINHDSVAFLFRYCCRRSRCIANAPRYSSLPSLRQFLGGEVSWNVNADSSRTDHTTRLSLPKPLPHLVRIVFFLLSKDLRFNTLTIFDLLIESLLPMLINREPICWFFYFIYNYVIMLYINIIYI